MKTDLQLVVVDIEEQTEDSESIGQLPILSQPINRRLDIEDVILTTLINEDDTEVSFMDFLLESFN